MAIVVLPAFPRFSGEKCSAAESTTEMDGNMFSLVEIIRRLAVHPPNVIWFSILFQARSLYSFIYYAARSICPVINTCRTNPLHHRK